MKYYTPVLNIKNAQSEYINGEKSGNFYNPTLGFSYYSPSYVLTNEDIRWVSNLTNGNGKRVLTVAASGDHPMLKVKIDKKYVQNAFKETKKKFDLKKYIL